jgi:hypothetical protein
VPIVSAAADARPSPAGPVVPAAASTAVRALLARPAAGRVLAAFPSALYVAVDEDVLAVVTSDGLRLPNAAVLAVPSTTAPFAGCRSGAPAAVHGGDLHAGGRAYRPVRWWSPREVLPRDRDGAVPVLRPAVVAELAGRLADAQPHEPVVRGVLDDGAAQLHRALVRRDPAGAQRAAGGLVGLGPGLTPAGDDLLAGLLVACAQLREAPGAADVAATAARLGDAVGLRASTATTALSAALLRHAAAGRAAGPVLRLLDALVGRTALPAALAGLLAVGHTSGHDTARGVLTAASALLDRATAVGAPPDSEEDR